MAGKLPEAEVGNYLRFVVERRISDAEKELEAARPKIGSTEWDRGYLKALEGLLLSRKANNDNYLFFAKKEFDKKSLKLLIKEFTEKAASPLYGDYDRGYFCALARLVKGMEENGVYSLSNNTRNQAEEAKAVAH